MGDDGYVPTAFKSVERVPTNRTLGMTQSLNKPPLYSKPNETV